MPDGAFVVGRDPQNPRDVLFQPRPGQDAAAIPETQLNLRDDVDRTLTVLRMLFAEGDPRFEEYFRSLLSLSQVGLVGANAQPQLAARALAAMKDDITGREGGRIKNQYMKYLGLNALVLGGPLVLAALIMHVQWPQFAVFRNFLFLSSGCMVGVWLSFGIRKVSLQFGDLSILEQDRLEPIVRLLFSGFLTVIIGLLFYVKGIEVKIGDISSAECFNGADMALLVGALCGVSEQALPSRISQEATSLLKRGE
jgi:hypothetical protein